MSLPVGRIEDGILAIRGHRVMLDADLAASYGVPTSRLDEAVTGNRIRITEDFTFQHASAEAATLISQFAMSRPGRGGRRTPPRVFIGQGVAMLSSVPTSDRAVHVNIAVMRALVRLRGIRAPMEPPGTPRRKIGF